MRRFWLCSFVVPGLLSGTVAGLAAVDVAIVNGGRNHQRLELALTGLPDSDNPFDPDRLRVDARIETPSGRTFDVPAFWYQPYQRALVGGSEVLTVSGAAGWRVRFWPTEAGSHPLTLRVATNGTARSPDFTTNLTIAAAAAPARVGVVEVTASKQFFQSADGQPLPLIGANVCWHGRRGTYDYSDWFPNLAAHGGNFARLWMCPWAFGLEAEPGTLTHYRLDRAWQLDRVFELAGQRGIHLLLCLDYHGMFATQKDYWGGGDDWQRNPYNAANGGPCATPDDFFTSATARQLYLKRLRYLIARYGASPHLLAWEFFNEIDNVFSAENGGLNESHVIAWHSAVGAALKSLDPFGHLVTSSLTGSSDRAAFWQVAALDFSQFHAYGVTQPALALAAIANRQRTNYAKPALVGEFGVDWRGWMRAEADPFLRGFRQNLWGATLGTSAGTGMSWYWENLHSEGVYTLHGVLRDILARSQWGRGWWQPIAFETGGPAPFTVGEVITGAPSFTVTLAPNSGWGLRPLGQLAVANEDASLRASSTLNAFVHGTGHSELKVPFKLNAWFEAGARLVAHVNSVSTGARLAVYSDSTSLMSTNLPDRDGKYDPFANEYNVDIPVTLPAGHHTVEIRNTGGDWFFLDWVRLEGVRPANYPGGWQEPVGAVGMRGASESLLYVVSPKVPWPGNALRLSIDPPTNQTVTLQQWPAGEFAARWFSTTNGSLAGETRATTSNGTLRLPLPEFAEDLAGIVVRVPALASPRLTPAGELACELAADADSVWLLESSPDLANWTAMNRVTNSPAPVTLRFSPGGAATTSFRLRLPD